MNWSRMMESTYWLKQTEDKPLFPALLWSRPENKNQAGKLLVIGGNSSSFAAPAAAYSEAVAAGIGTPRALLPDALQKVVGPLMPDALFAPSTSSGSFARSALSELLDEADWANACLIAGDVGRNSETAILLQKFFQKYSGLLTVAQDGLDYVLNDPQATMQRPGTLLVGSLGQLQKLLQAMKFPVAITHGMDLIKLVEVLHDFSSQYGIGVITKQHDKLFVAYKGQVSTTRTKLEDEDFWRVQTAAKASVWWLQNPTKPFEAMTTSLHTN